ncbi:hypothetical protein CDAR_511021 [Caerostris darwini]|uniref:Uncharacterized protein n=1 Tax=Caerostris darwini TaxID=1538125 RepID=A0AAV4TEG9_9ARAC|nr:hypothetical protein CDAR_511021 [Caerostris darwini]
MIAPPKCYFIIEEIFKLSTFMGKTRKWLGAITTHVCTMVPYESAWHSRIKRNATILSASVPNFGIDSAAVSQPSASGLSSREPWTALPPDTPEIDAK